MRRLDNAFLRTVGGGLPSLTSQLAFGGDGALRFDNFRVTAPLLSLTGSGMRRADGTLSIATRGTHRTYGPINATIEGLISRPQIVLRLANPVPAAQLSDVLLRLTPNADGFSVVANGGSLLGPFSANAAILLPRNGAPVIDIQSLVVSGTTARGRVAVVAGGLAGQLLVTGGGVDGSLVLSAPGGIQRILANMTARDARFAGPPPIMVGRGRLVATILLDPRGTDIDATFETTGFRRGTLSIARLAGNARLIDGVGTVRTSLAGARGRAFSVQSIASVSRDRIVINGNGALARRPIRLLRPIALTRISDGWRLDPTEMTYAGGRLQLSGSFGARSTTIVAGLDNMPLSLIDLAYPDSGLGGRASGRMTYADLGNQPSGTAQLRLTGLTRAGLSETSAPIDAAINAAVSPTSAAIRGVVQRGGTTIGRVQARVSPLAANGALIDRIMAAPLFAQVRYGGEAGTLWRLSGIEAIDVSGEVSVAADVRGTLNDPAITGVLRATNARVEAFASGTVVTGASAVGRFSGSQLQLRSISGQTNGGGTITGDGDFNLASADGFAMDLRLQAERALLIDRDDLVARVTGPVRLAGQGSGGTISGQLRLDAGSFRLGQATAVESLPVIRVIEINTPADRPDLRREQSPWRLALDITGRNRFMVSGLGLESEWSTDIGVRGDLTNFAITGTADLVRGDYTFAGRRFELQQGRIRFTGSTPIDPALDILAVDDIAGIDASIRVRGSGLRPEISFSSVPALPEDELLSRILFGASITDISVTEAAQLGLALASLRSGDGGLDPINAIRRATGLDRLRILPANTEIGAGTSVAAGKYLTRRTYVEIITDGQGYSATRAEFQITRWLALLGSISTLGQESVNVRVRRDY
jgi:translocation and assembly module TamB